MEKLKQWTCDVCGRIIEKPEDGYVVWKFDDKERKIFDYKILHHNYIDGDGKMRGCDNDDSYFFSSALTDFLGYHGMAKLLSMIDAGPMHREKYEEEIENLRDFLEFFRRVQLPYYEEARLYWQKAKYDGYFKDANEVWIYLPSTLKKLIKEYRPE